MTKVLTVICVAGIIGILAVIFTPNPEARASELPVTVTIPEEDNYAIFVPNGYEGVVVASQALPDEKVF